MSALARPSCAPELVAWETLRLSRGRNVRTSAPPNRNLLPGVATRSPYARRARRVRRTGLHGRVPSPLGRVQCDWPVQHRPAADVSAAAATSPAASVRATASSPAALAAFDTAPLATSRSASGYRTVSCSGCWVLPGQRQWQPVGRNLELPRVGAGVRAGLRGDRRLRMLCLCVARHAAGWVRGWAWALYTVYRANHRHPGFWRCGVRSSPT